MIKPKSDAVTFDMVFAPDEKFWRIFKANNGIKGLKGWDWMSVIRPSIPQ